MSSSRVTRNGRSSAPPEIRSGARVVMFSPWSKLSPRPAAHLPPVEEPPPDHGPTPDPPPVEQPPPTEDRLERFLMLVLLRRYATWCVRTGRIEQVAGAKRLWRAVAAARINLVFARIPACYPLAGPLLATRVATPC
jgi:hypothetical protein